MILTPRNAKRALAYWQKTLRLQDWDITVRIVRRDEMPNSGAAGAAAWDTYRTATIYLVNPTDFEEDWSERMRDMEDTLVHEMLHLHLDGCRIHSKDAEGNLTASGIAEERAIDTLTGALVHLARGA